MIKYINMIIDSTIKIGEDYILMKEKIIKLGVKKTVFICVILSIVFSLLLMMIIGFILTETGIKINVKVSLFMSIIIPALASPLIFTPIIKLIIHSNFLEKQLQQIANYDSLTGLLNRNAFLNEADLICKQTEKYKNHACLLYLDIDYFKQINDKYGHACGDKVLISFSDLLRKLSKSSDLVCRIGGDEFVILLLNSSLENGVNFIKKLNHSIANSTIKWDGIEVRYTISIGITRLITGADIFETINQADKALYDAKNNGRNQYKAYEII